MSAPAKKIKTVLYIFIIRIVRLIITRILCQIEVLIQIGRSDRKQIKVIRCTSAFLDAPLPRPDILPGSKASEAAQIGSSMAFPVKFPGPFIEDKIEIQFSGSNLTRSEEHTSELQSRG